VIIADVCNDHYLGLAARLRSVSLWVKGGWRASGGGDRRPIRTHRDFLTPLTAGIPKAQTALQTLGLDRHGLGLATGWGGLGRGTPVAFPTFHLAQPVVPSSQALGVCCLIRGGGFACAAYGVSMRTVGNILWHFPFFGFLVAAVTFLVGVIFVATVVAAPLGLGLIEFSKFLMAPFSYAMVTKKDLEIEQNKAWEAWSLVITILYFPLGLIAVAFNVIRIAMLCLTIIGIPIAIVAAKSLGTYLNPVNKKCVPVAVALELDRRRDRAVVEQRLGGATSEPVPKRVESAPTAAVVPVDHGPAVQLSAPGAAQPEPVALSTSPRTAAELAIAEARAAAAPTDPSAQRAFAELLQRTGNSQALVQWHKVAILDPDDAAALEALVALSADDSQRADALRNFAGYVAAHPGDRAARANQGIPR
jgi:uncharacterized membrane protein YccF (DUF307 family)